MTWPSSAHFLRKCREMDERTWMARGRDGQTRTGRIHGLIDTQIDTYIHRWVGRWIDRTTALSLFSPCCTLARCMASDAWSWCDIILLWVLRLSWLCVPLVQVSDREGRACHARQTVRPPRFTSHRGSLDETVGFFPKTQAHQQPPWPIRTCKYLGEQGAGAIRWLFPAPHGEGLEVARSL